MFPEHQHQSVASLMSMTSGIATPLTIEKSSQASSSKASSSKDSSSSSGSVRKVIVEAPEAPRFRSRRVNREEIQQPWLEKKHPREKFAWVLPLSGFVLGVALTGLICYIRLSGVPHQSFCPVMTDTFSSGTLDPNVWNKDVSLGGYG